MMKRRCEPISHFSILWKDAWQNGPGENSEASEMLSDLNLDQVLGAITSGRQDYDLKPFYLAPLKRVDEIQYRHEVFRDLENKSLAECIRRFGRRMLSMQQHFEQGGKL